jgi:hypothetical protein
MKFKFYDELMQPLTDISIVRGDSYPIVMYVQDSISGELVDLTGYALFMTVATVKYPIDETSIYFQVSGEIAVDQAGEKGKVTFTPTLQNTGVVGNFFFDIQVVYGEFIQSMTPPKRIKIIQNITKNPVVFHGETVVF